MCRIGVHLTSYVTRRWGALCVLVAALMLAGPGLVAGAQANQCQGPPAGSNDCEPDLRLPADELNQGDGVTTGYIGFPNGGSYPAYTFAGHYSSLGPGRFGNAFTFDGSNNDGLSYDTATSPDNHDRLSPSPAFTEALWVKATNPGANRSIAVRGARNCGGVGAWGLVSGPNGGLQFYTAVRNNQYVLTPVRTPEIPAAAIWDDNWHAVAGVFDGGSAASRHVVSLWVDGRQVAASDIGSGGAESPPVYADLTDDHVLIGRGSDQERTCGAPARGFNGSVDEVELFHKALSATQLATLQSAAATTPPDVPYAPEIKGPSLSGSPKVGEQLTCTDRDTLNGRSFTWERGSRAAQFENDPSWFPIADASGTHYVVQDADAGSQVRCHEYGTLMEGSATLAVDRASSSLRADTDVPIAVDPHESPVTRSQITS